MDKSKELCNLRMILNKIQIISYKKIYENIYALLKKYIFFN